MALSKLPNVFADAATQAFIREACLRKLPNGERAIAIHALECDSEIISIFACVADGQRFLDHVQHVYDLGECPL